MIWQLDLLLYLAIVLSAVAALVYKDLLASVAALGAMSFFVALLFAEQAAVDVAFTEVAVGASVTAIFYIVGVFLTERRSLD